MRTRQRAPRASVILVAGMAMAVGACGHKSNSPPSPAPGPTSGSVAVGSATADPLAQALVVSVQLDATVQALSDGGTGANGGGGAAAGLTESAELDDTAVAQTCKTDAQVADLPLVSPDGSVSWTVKAHTPIPSVTHTFTGGNGHITYSANADGSASGDTELWYPGPYFGLANIKPDSHPDGATWGSLAGLDTVPGVIAAAGAPTKTSGALGSVGFRTVDGSWDGAPVWEVGTHYAGWLAAAVIPVKLTAGMTMYVAKHPPTVTTAPSVPSIGGAYYPTQMVGPDFVGGSTPTADQLEYMVLGETDTGGILPSFTSTGMHQSGGSSEPVGQAGTVTTAGVPGRIYNPPTTLACDPLPAGVAWPLPGWRFSQNVAGLTRVSTSTVTLTRSYAKGTAALVRKGSRTLTFSDPAVVAPVTNTPTAPYFDENAGQMTTSYSMSLASKAAPNTTTSVYSDGAGIAKPMLTSAIYSSAPFLITTTHNINDLRWTWVRKTVQFGTLTGTSATGDSATPDASVVTTFSAVAFVNQSNNAELACVPTAGQITAVITPTDPALQVATYTLRFGTSVTGGVNAPSGVTSQVTCTGGNAAAINCIAAPEIDDPDYRPTGCNF